MSDSGLVIIAGLATAIYFIIDDAIDKKIENCMYKHFFTTNVLATLNVTLEKDPAKIPFSTEECQSIVDQGLSKTKRKINALAAPDCYKKLMTTKFLNFMMFKGVLEKFDKTEQATAVEADIHKKIAAECKETITTPVISETTTMK